MASAFGHGIVAYTFRKIGIKESSLKVTLLAICCSIIPDLDVIAFKFGIPYEHMFGHRGISHSIFFAILFGFVIGLIFHRKHQFRYSLLYLFCTLSHGIIDTMTTGGRGIALWAPFSDERIFFPYRFIKVSPLGIEKFFSEWGMKVLINEFSVIWIPCLIVLALHKLIVKN